MSRGLLRRSPPTRRRAPRAGAAIVHFHARDPSTGAPSTDPFLYGDTVRRIRATSDLVVMPTLGANTLPDPVDRVAAAPRHRRGPEHPARPRPDRPGLVQPRSLRPGTPARSGPRTWCTTTRSARCVTWPRPSPRPACDRSLSFGASGRPACSAPCVEMGVLTEAGVRPVDAVRHPAGHPPGHGEGHAGPARLPPETLAGRMVGVCRWAATSCPSSPRRWPRGATSPSGSATTPTRSWARRPMPRWWRRWSTGWTDLGRRPATPDEVRAALALP